MQIGIIIAVMHDYISRDATIRILKDLHIFPVVVLLGPRQSRKSTLVKVLARDYPNSLYLDSAEGFILLGSASRKLVNVSGESLAGRASYLELSAFSPTECARDTEALFRLLVRGGFPEAFLAESDGDSFRWRQAFISSYRFHGSSATRASIALKSRLLELGFGT